MDYEVRNSVMAMDDKKDLFSVFIPMSPKSSIIFVNFTTWNLQKKKKLKSSLKQSQVS